MNIAAFPRREGNGKPLEFAKATDCLFGALSAIEPPKRMRVAEAAEAFRYIRTSGDRVPWRNDVAPYMVEPMDWTLSRRYRSAVMVAPARASKTEGMILNVLAHRIMCQPCNARVIHMDITSAREFSLEKLGGMLRASPEIAARQLTTRGADNTFEKRFRGGMRISIGWPVISQLSASDLDLICFSDYDRMTDNVDGEGAPFPLGRKRVQAAGTLGMAIAESSPGRLILDEDWRQPANAPHMAPPTTGILSLYNEGTRGRFHWTCPHCGTLFEPRMERMQWKKEGSPQERGASAFMVCPSGCVIEPAAKRDLNRRGAWLHEADDGSLVPLGDAARQTDTVSWWLMGACAAFQSWAEIVTRYLTAVETFRLTGDEQDLKTTVNVDQGMPYLPRALGTGGELTADSLHARAERYPIGVAPAGARFVTVQVDVQTNRFVVQVDAWGVGLERWLVDRFDLHTPPPAAPGAESRAIDPARFVEDWDALFDLLERRYPVQGSGYALQPVALIVDSGGAPGVTKNAYAFYRKARRKRLRRRVFLAKGVGGPDKPRAEEVAPEKENGQRPGRRTMKAKDLMIVRVGTDPMKDDIVAALSRKEPGPGAYHLPEGLDRSVFEEFCAERRTAKGWEKKAGQRRNEALDLAGYGKALAIVLGAEKIDWDRAASWARPVAENEFGVVMIEAKPEQGPETVLDGQADDDEPREIQTSSPPAEVSVKRKSRKPPKVSRSRFLR